MAESKGWDWSKVKGGHRKHWQEPSIESFYLLDRWKNCGVYDVLDLGCGIGRHTVLFAEKGFNISSIDVSPSAIEATKALIKSEGWTVDCRQGDMQKLPYEDASFDAIYCRNVVSHTDTLGVRQTIAEIRRVLRWGGECYITLASKLSWGFAKTNWPMVDENTKIRQQEGPEYGVPHFYADYNLIQELFMEFEILKLYQIEDYYTDENDGRVYSSWHWHLLVQKA